MLLSSIKLNWPAFRSLAVLMLLAVALNQFSVYQILKWSGYKNCMQQVHKMLF
jgi:hypothetical protein